MQVHEFTQFIQQNLLLSLVWVAVLIALILNIFKSSTAKFQFVSVAELTRILNNEGGIAVDTRSGDDFKRGHITDAVHLMASEIKNSSFGALENKKSVPIIVVCANGQSAQESAKQLVNAGYEQVSILKDGMNAWNEANLPLVRGKK